MLLDGKITSLILQKKNLKAGSLITRIAFRLQGIQVECRERPICNVDFILWFNQNNSLYAIFVFQSLVSKSSFSIFLLPYLFLYYNEPLSI